MSTSSSNSSSSSSSSSFIVEKKKLTHTDFYPIASQINHRSTLNGKELASFLKGIERGTGNFYRNVDNPLSENWCPDRENYTLVIGEDAIGKSIFIGYQMGAKVLFTKQNLNSGNLGFKVADFEVDGNSYPKISHVRSKPGFDVYQKYIECRGLFSLNDENRLCSGFNEIPIKKFSPQRVIVIISDDLFALRGQKFIDFLQKMHKFLSNGLSLDVFSSVLFVKCKCGTYTKENQLFGMVKKTIELLRSLISRLQPNYFLLNQEQIHELFKDGSIHKDDVSKIKNYLKDIELLGQLSLENFLVVDYSTDDSREKIYEWEKSHGNLNSRSLSIEHFMGEIEYSQFKNIFAALITYFNGLFEKKYQRCKLVMQLDVLEIRDGTLSEAGVAKRDSARVDIRSIESDINLFSEYCKLLRHIILDLRLETSDEDKSTCIYSSFLVKTAKLK